jgi:release factor glutamine methyltransferase
LTVRDALTEATGALERADVPSPLVDAEWLLSHVLGVKRSELYTVAPELDEAQLGRFDELVERRAGREPLAYILGEWGFRRLTLVVDPRVLIPRPETEAVVDRCLALLDGVDEPAILDVGVGSGAIALALADERPDARVVGTDVSPEALEVAEENRVRAEVDGRVRFVLGDLFAGEPGPFDLVVSNPPYVTAEELAGLEPELQREPCWALIGEGAHAAVATAALDVLNPGAALVFEAGDGQAATVAELLTEVGYDDVRISPDLAGRERVVEGRRP